MPVISSLRFGNCELDLAGYEVRRDGEPCAVEPQVFELLAYLARNPGRLVGKDELIAEVWGGRAVSDAALSSRIKSARRAIGDDGEQQRFIRTVHGRGFRFVAEIESAGPAPSPAASLAAPRTTASGRPAIAVLPFRPGSADEVDRYLAETVTDDIVTCLARDRTLAVSAQCSVEPASSGGPRYVLEGSVRGGARMVVTARLMDAVEGRHIWAERCEQRLESTRTLDDRTARLVSAVVRGEIEAAEARRATATAEPERDAWAHYHLGLKELYRFTRAMALDPHFASAAARLAYVHIQEYWYGAPDQRDQALIQAQTVAAHAIALDPKNALGHLAAGRVHALRHEFDLAMPEFETAVRLNPGLAQAYFAFGQAYFYAGRPREAVRVLDTAIELGVHDPHFWSFLHDQADAYYALGRLDDAVRGAKAASRHPNATHWPFASLASVLGTARKTEEAREALHQLLAHSPGYNLVAARADLAHFGNAAHVEQFLAGLKAAELPGGRA